MVAGECMKQGSSDFDAFAEPALDGFPVRGFRYYQLQIMDLTFRLIDLRIATPISTYRHIQSENNRRFLAIAVLD